jgi:predicted RNA-binding Zn ribbon-like protein
MPRPRSAKSNAPGTPAERLRRVGGHPALDFVNTIDPDEPQPDRLTDYRSLVAWAEAVNLLAPAEAAALRRLAAAEPVQAARWLDAARHLREAAAALFRAAADKRPAARSDLDRLNSWLRRLTPIPDLAPRGSSYVRNTPDRQSELAQPAMRAAVSIADLLTSPDLAHVRMCEAPGCGWVFLDRSPTRRRRWCSMAGCGNRAKAQRHSRRAATGGGTLGRTGPS